VAKQNRFTTDDDEGDEDSFDLESFLAEYQNALRIDEHALDEALLDQAPSYYEISKQVALQGSRRDALKQYLKEVEARVDIEIREEAQSAGEKVTEGLVTSRRLIHKDIQRAHRMFARGDRAVQALQALKEAYTQRSYALKELVNLWISNYYENSESEAATRASRDIRARGAKDQIRKSLKKQTT